MPPVPQPNDLPAMLAALAQRITALERQQNQVLTNVQGQAVAYIGQSPGLKQYGIQFVNPANGTPTMFAGEDPSGNPYVAFYNSSGVKTSQFDATGLHFYDGSGNEIIRTDQQGFHVYNTSAQEEARLGQLSASPAIYGIGVAPSTGSAPGTLQQVGGAITSGPGSFNTTSTTPVAITGTSVTAMIGPSGKALITLCGNTEMNSGASGGGYAYMGVSIDGVTPTNWTDNFLSLANAQVIEANSISQVVSGLSTGTHTFQGYAWMSATGVTSVQGGSVYVTVQPL